MNNDLTLLTDAAKASGEIALKHWQQNPETWDKDAGAGPVTEADIAIDRMLASELGSARPDYGWLSEETDDNSDRLNHERVFIVDPIDGTRAFIAGEKTFSHSLAIAENGNVIAAAVYLPVLDLMYLATSDQVSTLNGAPISATQNTVEGASVLAAKPNFDVKNWSDGLPPYQRHFRSSLAYRLCLVAEGRFDAMLTLRDTWEWDVAAGCLIAQQAGATVTDRVRGIPKFNNPRPKLKGMIAGGTTLHEDIAERLQSD
ncbi:3'(2'),5'-bisphosphate nucleotidase CysQ [Cochlodiniinecator piscidefendens]|uniref:3'(2'),5'-bisphosphate nucleotidase CysQ n=1 Tax=Cochlodiniinecator piscidefendens TaxID=2715756 RepID=UPI002F42A9F4